MDKNILTSQITSNRHTLDCAGVWLLCGCGCGHCVGCGRWVWLVDSCTQKPHPHISHTHTGPAALISKHCSWNSQENHFLNVQEIHVCIQRSSLDTPTFHTTPTPAPHPTVILTTPIYVSHTHFLYPELLLLHEGELLFSSIQLCHHLLILHHHSGRGLGEKGLMQVVRSKGLTKWWGLGGKGSHWWESKGLTENDREGLIHEVGEERGVNS